MDPTFGIPWWGVGPETSYIVNASLPPRVEAVCGPPRPLLDYRHTHHIGGHRSFTSPQVISSDHTEPTTCSITSAGSIGGMGTRTSACFGADEIIDLTSDADSEGPGREGNRSLVTGRRALSVKEIQHRVFSFSSRMENARCARVCREWTEVALDCLWQDMDSLQPLLQLLSPLVRVRPNVVKFARELSQDDWDRFTPYAKRVHSLTIRLHGGHPDLDATVFASLARSCAYDCMLPDIVTVNISGFHTSAVILVELLLNRHLRNLSLNFDESHCTFDSARREKMRTLWSSLAEKSPDIHCLEIGGKFSDTDGKCLLSASFRDVVFTRNCSKLLNLKRFSFYPFKLGGLTFAPVLASLAFLPALQAIRCPRPLIKAGNCLMPHAELQRIDRCKSFQQLTSLHIFATPEDLSHLFSSPRAFSNLIDLQVEGDFSANVPLLGDFLKALVIDSCLLEKLVIEDQSDYDRHEENTRYIDPQIDDISDRADLPIDHVERVITAGTLRPLSLLLKLKELRISHQQPLALNDTQLIYILRQCPSLTVLCLNERPHSERRRRTSLSLAVFAMFASCCPKLVKLSLYIDGFTPYAHRDKPPDALFRHLIEIDLGNSRITDPLSVQRYLSGLVVYQRCSLHGGIVHLNLSDSRIKLRLERLEQESGIKDSAYEWIYRRISVPLMMPVRDWDSSTLCHPWKGHRYTLLSQEEEIWKQVTLSFKSTAGVYKESEESSKPTKGEGESEATERRQRFEWCDRGPVQTDWDLERRGIDAPKGAVYRSS